MLAEIIKCNRWSYRDLFRPLFPKVGGTAPWGRCFDIGGRLSLFLNTYFLYNIVVFTLKKNLTCVYGGRGR